MFKTPVLFAQTVPVIPNSPIDFPPAFECVFIPDFENNFSIRRSTSTQEKVTIDLAMPLVGDVTGDGSPEILIPAKQVDPTFRNYITSHTRNILVYKMTNDGMGTETLVKIGEIQTPYFSIESPAQFVLAKVDGGAPLIIVAASWEPLNNCTNPSNDPISNCVGLGGQDYRSKLVAYRFNGSTFEEEWVSTESYGRNVPWSSKPLKISAIDPIYQFGHPLYDPLAPPRYYRFPSGGAPAVADFNADGSPEVYIYNEIFNAETGQFITSGEALRDPALDEFDSDSYYGQGISQVSPGNSDEMIAGTTAVSVAADLDNDGVLELAAGNTIYKVNINSGSTSGTMTPILAPNFNGNFLRDGYTSIADINLDGQLDVVVSVARKGTTMDRQLYAWTLSGGSGSILGYKLIPNTSISDPSLTSNTDVAISLPFIGDVNGDKKPNIGFTTPKRLWMLEFDPGGQTFRKLTTWPGEFISTNDRSGHTYITMFDFDQDGRQDLVYRDEENLRILDGITSANRPGATFPSYSQTANEGAIVADVDMDGEAEILVTDRGSDPFDGNNQLDRSAFLVVYKSLTKPWAPARSVWNQYAYFSFNVNQDLTIPVPQPNHGRTTGFYFPKYNEFGCLESDEFPFNNFLVQTTLYNDAGCQTTAINLMDAEVEILSSRFICPAPDQSIEFEMLIRNASDAIGDSNAAIPTDTPLSFYVDGVFIGQYTLADFGLPMLMPGEEVTFSTSIVSAVADELTTGVQNFQAIINWDDASQNVVYEECIYDNESTLPLISRPLYSINSPSPLCYEDNSGLINSFVITPVNTVAGSVESTQLQWFLNDPAGTPLTNDGTYSIDPVDQSLSITGLNPGVYQFYLVDGCTQQVVDTQIEVYPLPSATFSSTQALCFDSTSGSLLVDNHQAGYVYYVSGILFDGSNFAETRFDSESALENAGFKAGDYTIRTVNENGTNCQTISQVSISQPDQLQLIDPQEVDPICEPSNGSISWTITGGTPSASFPFYTYQLTNNTTGETFDNADISDLGSSRVGVSNLPGGNYTLNVTDNNSCEVIQNFELTIQEDPAFEFPNDATICEGDEHVAQLNVLSLGTPAANPVYQWGVGTGSAFSPLSSGQSVAGGTIEISGDGLTATFRNLAPNPAGHEFVVRIENACDQPESTFLIQVNPIPQVDVSTQDISCFGGSDGQITLTRSAAADPSENYEYTLTETGENNTTGVFSNLPFQSNPYVILVRNLDTQCLDYISVPLNQPSQVQLIDQAIVDATCGQSNGAISGTVTGGNGPYEVSLVLDGSVLSTVATSDAYSFTDLGPGTYTLEAKDSNDCISPALSAPIINDDKAAVSLVLEDIESCESELIQLVPQIDTQGFPRTVNWYKDAAMTELISAGADSGDPSISYNLAGENLEISGLLEGTFTYYLGVSGENFCPVPVEEVTVTISAGLNLELVYDQEICFGEGVTVTANASGGNEVFEYSLDGGPFQASNTFDAVSAGDHTLTVQTNQGCSLSEDFTVVGPSAPISINDDPVLISTSCGLDNGEISNIQISGGYGNYTLTWYKDDLNSTPIATDFLELSDLAIGTYFVSIVDEGGCEFISTFEISELPSPEVSITEDQVCIGESISLIPVQTVSGAAPTDLIWYADAATTLPLETGPDATDPNITYTIAENNELTIQGLPVGTYTYYLQVVCTGELVEAKAVVNPLPAPEFVITDVLCFGEESGKITVNSGGSSTYTYTLNGGNSMTQNELESLNLPSGLYTLGITDSQTGCFSQTEVEITQPEALVYSKGNLQDPTCGDDNGSFDFTLSGGVGPYQIQINGQAIDQFSFSENLGVYSLSNLGPGDYSITIQDSNGCLLDFPNEFTLVNNEGTTIQIDPMQDFICEGEIAELVPQIVTASGNSPQVRWFLDENLTQPITSNYDPSGSGIMYQINTGDGSLEVFNLPAGTFEYYIQLSGPEFCTISEVAEVEVSQQISAEPVITPITCFGENDGQLELINIQGGNDPLEFSLNGGPWQDSPLFSDLEPGSYTISVRDQSGNFNCTLEIPDLLVEGPTAPISLGPDVIVERSSCDLENGSISNLEIQGGWGNYQIEWRSNAEDGPVINSGDLSGISNLGPGVYFLIVVDEKGCKAVFDFEITEQNKPDYSPVAVDPICEGELITLEAINTVSDASSTTFTWSKTPNLGDLISEGEDPNLPGVAYVFEESGTTLGLQISGLPAGNYTYYLTIECTGQEIPFAFEVRASPAPVFEKSDITCFGVEDGKIRVSSGGESDFVYSINGASGISAEDLEALNFAPGIYEIQVGNEANCLSEIYRIEITQPELLEIIDVETKNSACGSNDGFIEVTWNGGTPNYAAVLLENGTQIQSQNTGDNTIRFSNLSPGEYSIEITDLYGCFVNTTGNFTLVDGPSEIILQDLAICEGESAILTPQVNPANSNASYSWYWGSVSAANLLSDGDSRAGVSISINSNGTLQLDGLVAGNNPVLFVTVSGPGICEGEEKRVEVQVDSAPQVSYVKQDEACFGEGGSIQFSGSDIDELQFSLNGGAFTSYSNGLIENLVPGNYQVVVQNTTGCQTQLTETIEILGPTAELSFEEFEVNPSSCQSQDGEILGLVSGGSAPYSVSLFSGSGSLLEEQNTNSTGDFSFTGLQAGDYQIRVSDSKGCLLNNGAITISDEPTVISVDDITICEGETGELMATFSQSIASVSFDWYYDEALTQPVLLNASSDQFGATYQSSGSGSLQINGLTAQPGTYTYFVMVSGDGVCPPESQEVTVTVNPLPTLRVSNPSIVCDPNQTVDLTQFIEGFNPNVFDYIIESPSGSPLRLDQISAVNLSGSYLVQASFKDSQCFTPVNRIAVVIADTELIAEFDYQIEFAGSQPVVNSDVQVLEDVQFLDSSVGDPMIWDWDFGDGNSSSEQNPVHQYEAEGTYTVTLTTIDSFGCISETQRLIQVFDDYLIIVPNAFTPNGEKNQFFVPKYRGIASMDFYIFTTWGELIFETSSLESPGWDGTYKGQEAMNGNYVYRAVFMTRTGTKVERSGVFVLIR